MSSAPIQLVHKTKTNTLTLESGQSGMADGPRKPRTSLWLAKQYLVYLTFGLVRPRPNEFESSLPKDSYIRSTYGALRYFPIRPPAKHIALWTFPDSKLHFALRETLGSAIQAILSDISSETHLGLSICCFAVREWRAWDAILYPRVVFLQRALSSLRDASLRICYPLAILLTPIYHLFRLLAWLLESRWSNLRGFWSDIWRPEDQRPSFLQMIGDYLIREHWISDDDEMQEYKAFIERSKTFPTETDRWQPNLPSKRLSTAGVRTYALSPILLDEVFILSFKWIRIPPRFNNDLFVYSIEPLRKRPFLIWAHVIFLKPRSSDSRKAVLSTCASSVLERINNSREAIFGALKGISAMSVPVQSMWLLASLCDCISQDLLYFTKRVDEIIDNMYMRGRNSPSGFKIKYLIHLKEYLTFTIKQARSDLKQTRKLIRPPMALDDGMYDAWESVVRSLDDIEYITAEMELQAPRIDEVCTKIKDQMDLSNGFWNTVLAFVVAVYVPLAFSSSVFGMNIRDDSISQYWTNITTFSNSSSKSTPILSDVQNQQTSTNLPGTKVWTIRDFVITSVALILGSIVLPFSIGTIARSSVRLLNRYSTGFQLLIMFIVGGAVWGTFIYLVAKPAVSKTS